MTMMNRIYHHWEKWECYKAGFYGSQLPFPMTPDEAKKEYAIFLADIPRFCDAMERVLIEWPVSCDQFLSNDNINRIAWLGQSSMFLETGVPSMYRGGFRMLSVAQQRAANNAAQSYLDKWLRMKGDEAGRRIHSELDEMRLF